MSRNMKLVVALLGVAIIGLSTFLGIRLYTKSSETIVATGEPAVIVKKFEPPQSTTTTEVTATTMSPPEGGGDVTTTTTASLPKWIDYPSSDRLVVDKVGTDVEVVVTGPNKVNGKNEKNNPVTGTIDLWVSPDPFTSVESIFVEPCELGLVFAVGHTNKLRSNNNGGVAYEWINYESVDDDGEGLLAEDRLFFESTDTDQLVRFTCVYQIREWPEWVFNTQTPGLFQRLGDTPAAFYPKESGGLPTEEVFIPLVDQLVMQPGGVKGLLALTTSYGGPSGREYRSEYSKYYESALLAELVDIRVENLPLGGIR